MKKLHLPVLLMLFFMLGCGEDYVPKPRGFFRIALPEKDYVMSDSALPYRFAYSENAFITHDPHAPDQKNWINIVYPRFKGKIHVSYKSVDGNLSEYTEDSRNFVMKHIPKSTGIIETLIADYDRKVFGMLYEIQGAEAASPLQFYLTDSVSHFIRGALYFNTEPNNDSLSPVISYIRNDVDSLIQSIEWL